MTTPVLSPLSLTSYYDPYNGAVLNASLYFYKAQSLDPFTVYTDSGLAIPHAQPVLTGGSGRVPPVWIGQEAPYRVRTFDQYGTLLEDIDNIPGAFTPDEGDGGGGTGNDGSLPPAGTALDLTLLKTGDIFASFAAGGTARAGAVRCNGQTIGSATSGASERANADTHALFVFLWQQDAVSPNELLPVLGGKGSTSEGDWTANKQITLPDLRGRTIVGTDPMGSGISSGRMTGAKFTKTTGTGSDASVPGAAGGVASITLTIQEIPWHTHAVTDPGHTHVVYDPTHTHQVYDPTHRHGYDRYSAEDPKTQTVTTANQGRNNTRFDTAAAATGIQIYGVGTGISLYSPVYTGISVGYVGGDPAAGQATKPFSLAQPFLTLTWYIKL